MDVGQFSANFAHGARANLYSVYIDDMPEKIKFLVKATSIPSVDVGVIEVPFMDKTIKIAGDLTFAEWNTTLMLDEDYAGRIQLEEWAQKIKNFNEVGGSNNVADYFRTATVTQLSGDGVTELRKYKIYNLFPQTVPTIDLSWESKDTISEYEVTWAYTYWTPVS
ncbi:hypothetical protein [uncultured Arcobacter sp.]|uniref:hypothetical protein n=1 Tax=uncultured Arcobacter sp. TaxID=165434 RepID=UPI0026385BDF|nr:hypothetical protein [uncultured Arcobacter sp.]